MAEESEARAKQDVIAASEGYGGPVSDQELAEVYLPEGQDKVQDNDSAQPAGDGQAQAQDPVPDGSGTTHGSPDEPAIEPPD